MSAEETTRQAADPVPEGAGRIRADGPREEHADVAAMVTELLNAGCGLDYMAWCRDGQYELESDLFDPRDRTAVTAAEGRDTDGTGIGTGVRNACRRIAEKLSLDTDEKLDRRLSMLRTGRLVRTVLTAEHGAVYCDQVVPGSHLVGATIGLPDDPVARRTLMYRADEAIGWQVDTFRERIHAGNYDLGGWYSERIRAELRAAPIRRKKSGNDGDAPNRWAVLPVVTGDADHPAVREVCRVVRTRDLHLIALFEGDTMTFCVDVLQDLPWENVDTQERPPAPAVRRGWYADLGAELPDYLRELARTARAAIGGPLSRAVLDVEDGAIYYRLIDDLQYVVGVTVFQPQVFSAERQVDTLMDAWPARG